MKNIELKHKLDLLEPLMGFIAHKLNNSLAIINGYTEMIQLENSNNEKVMDKVNKITQSSNRMSDFILQLLLLSDRCPLAFKCIKVEKFIEMLSVNMKDILNNRFNIKATDTKRSLIIDADQFGIAMSSLINVFNNITDNKCTLEFLSKISDDELIITLSFAKTRYKFIDEGFFDPFSKESGDLKEDCLALLLLYSMVKKHKGTIDVKCIDNNLKFEINLPLK